MMCSQWHLNVVTPVPTLCTLSVRSDKIDYYCVHNQRHNPSFFLHPLSICYFTFAEKITFTIMCKERGYWKGCWWCQSLLQTGCISMEMKIVGVKWRGPSTGTKTLQAEFLCLRLSVGVGRQEVLGVGRRGSNKLSHCRKVCSCKSHLPVGTRAMPEGYRVKGRSVALQNTQITYQPQSIKRLLSLLQTPATVFLSQ